MMRHWLCRGTVGGIALAMGLLLAASAASAAPRINNLSLRGLQSGSVTTLVIEGSEFLPDAKVWFLNSGVHPIIKGATPERLEIEVPLEAQVPGGIYLLRVASASGISPAVAVGVDGLSQIPFASQLSSLNVAMSGALNGSTVLSTSFAGKQGQQVVVEIESQRLGASLKPVLHLYDARHVQLAWSQPIPALAGDARLTATLPADGVYTIELHDALFRGADPGFFRLKVGEFRFADVAFPLAVQQGTNATFEFASSNLPGEARATGSWAKVDGGPQFFQPAPWPAGVALLSGSRPTVIVSERAEILEAAAGEKLQEISAAPVAINGRIAQAGEQDRYRLSVTPGQQLRFDVLARRAGSALDGVLSIQNEQGGELAANDDRPGSSDPLLDFKVPENVNVIVIALRDLQRRGGADDVYRIAVDPIGVPDFSLALSDERYQAPRDGVALARVRVNRMGYNGPIQLQFSNLPQSVSVAGNEIPAGATEALLTLSAAGQGISQAIGSVLGIGSDANLSLKRTALIPENTVNQHQPWLRDELAVAVTGPGPLALAWEANASDARLHQGMPLPVKLSVQRAAGVTGAVRLSLLTTQDMPKKVVKVNNQDSRVDDVERAIRFEAGPTIPADQHEAMAKVLVPADLPKIAYDLAIQAELLSADGKTVLATAVTPARRLTSVAPILLATTSSSPLEAHAGLGSTGKLTGKLLRTSGYTSPVKITLEGLPKGVVAPVVTLLGNEADFEIPLALPFGTPAGDLPNVKLVATSQTDPLNADSLVRANEIGLALKVVPGEKPPVEKPLLIFEDQSEFVGYLNQGGGQISLNSEEKYSGAFSLKVTPEQRFNPLLPGLGWRIREKPAPGEYRFLQFAWKKQGGQSICLQLNHDGQWGPVAGQKPQFRYHAGPGGEPFGASLAVDGNLPSGFTLVTRDLFADFGEFTLTGLSLAAVDGEYALFDHIYLGATPEDFGLVKP